MFIKDNCGGLATMDHHTVVKVVAESRMLSKHIIMISHKEQIIFFHAGFVKMWLL